MMSTGCSVEGAKLQLVESIAKSQAAMARMLDSLADISEQSPDIARHLAENIKILTRYQQAIAQTVCGISLHQVYYGTPSSPWITQNCYPANMIARGEWEDEA